MSKKSKPYGQLKFYTGETLNPKEQKEKDEFEGKNEPVFYPTPINRTILLILYLLFILLLCLLTYGCGRIYLNQPSSPMPDYPEDVCTLDVVRGGCQT